MFQTTVASDIAAGVVGELAFEGPLNGQPGILQSPDAANNVIGRAFTVVSEGVFRAGGTGAFAGILANPKVYASGGTAAGGTLAATMTLRNNEVGEFVQMTPGIFVSLPAAAAIGDYVVYNTTTGELATMAPGGTVPGGFAVVPNATVQRYSKTAGTPGLAVIAITGPAPLYAFGTP